MNHNQLIFQSVFGKNWQQLPPVIRKHYSHQKDADEIIVVKGTMNIEMKGLMSYLLPFFKLFKVLVPYSGKNVPVVIYLRSQANALTIHFERTFYFPGKFPYHFHSYMVPIKENKVVEYTRLGLGWKMLYVYEKNKLKLKHAGYAFKFFGFFIPLPLTLLLGKMEVEKEAISDDAFLLTMKLTHPILGAYLYTGEFRI